MGYEYRGNDVLKKGLLLIFMIFIPGFVSALALNEDELEFFKDFFHDVQLQSFKHNSEYCGYIGYNDHDEFIATKPRRGTADGCTPDLPPEDFDLIGSYHTHGAFSEDADSELPSVEDMQADMAEDVDGFIATPGGRIWHIDTIENISRMVCGRNCVVADPNFEDGVLPPVAKSYTLSQLKERDSVDDIDQ